MSEIIRTFNPNSGISFKQVKTYHIDWGFDTTSQISAISIPFSSSLFTSINVFDALEELAGKHVLSRHAIDDSTAHIGISGPEDNLMAINSDGLPKDSGIVSQDVKNLIELGLYVPDSTSESDIDIYFRDKTRNKYLGIAKEFIIAGRNNYVTNRYLENVVGSPMNETGQPLETNMTLVGISMSCASNTVSWTAQVRKNGALGVIDSLSITNQFSNSNLSKNTDFNQGDLIEIYCLGVHIPKPFVKLIFRPRL